MTMNELHDVDWTVDGTTVDDWATPVVGTEPRTAAPPAAHDWTAPTVGAEPRTGTPPARRDWAVPVVDTEPAARNLPGDRWARAPRQPRSAGPLVAICGLCGGAGATTVAYLTARAVARAVRAPVFVCDTGGPTGGLAAYAAVETPRSLPHVADAVAAYEPIADSLFAHAADDVRVMASRPELGAPPDPNGLRQVLADARAAHSLSIVDCGLPAGETERQVLEVATHVIWVLPATLSGIRRAQRTLPLFGSEASRREIVVARGDAAERRAPSKELTELAATRAAALVLMPHVPDLGEHSAERALEEAGLSLDAIQMAIRR